MKVFVRALGICAALSYPSASWASVTVDSSPTGVASVSQRGAVRLNVGDRLDANSRVQVARGRGDTVLRYDDGCEVRLRPGQIYTVLDVSPCVPAVAPVVQTPVLGGIAPAVVGVAVAGAVVGGVVAVTSGKGGTRAPIYISP